MKRDRFDEEAQKVWENPHHAYTIAAFGRKCYAEGRAAGVADVKAELASLDHWPFLP